MRLTSAVAPSALAAASALSACAPPQPIPVDLAEAQCVQQVLSGANTSSTVTVGFGTGTGYGGWGGPGWYGSGWGGWGGTGVVVSTAVPVGMQQNPAQQYDNCVIRKSGQPPVTPFAKRPELKG